MTYQRRAYDDLDTSRQMSRDCAACATHVDLPRQRQALDLDALVSPAPSLEHRPTSGAKRKHDIEVSDAAAHLASRLHLHLD